MKSKEIFAQAKFPEEQILLKKRITKEDVDKVIKEFTTQKVLQNRILNVLADTFQKIEETNKRVADIVVNASNFSTIRKYCKDYFDPTTLASDLKKGLFGYLWGANVWVHKSANDEFFCFPEDSKELKRQFPSLSSSPDENLKLFIECMKS
jgi:hypothetical protein